MRHFKLGISVTTLAFIFTFSFFFFAPSVVQAEEAATVITTSENPASDVSSDISSPTENNSIETDTTDNMNSSEDNNSEEETTGEEATKTDTPAATQPVTSPSTQKPQTTPATAAAKPVAKAEKKDRETNLDRWLDVCETIGDNLKKRHFIYSNSRTKSTYKAALSRRKRSNCALYVSWCLQEYGALKSGQTFYVRGSGSIRKNFRKWGSKVKVIRVNKRCPSANLQAGDVVCWSGLAHVNVYAGKNKDGDRLWYDAGKAATYSGRSGSRYENVGAKQLSYLNSKRISYIIRIKDV